MNLLQTPTNRAVRPSLTPSVEDVEDASDIQPKRAVPKKASNILELADGSDDDNEPEPITINSDKDDEDTDINSDDNETPAKSAEAELGKFPMTERRPVEIS